MLAPRSFRQMSVLHGDDWYKFCGYCDVALGAIGMYYCHPCRKIKNQAAADKARATKARNKALGLHKQKDYRTVEEIEWRAAVSAMTKKAIRLGFLPKLDGSILCVDCGRKEAQCYDHRDYSRPLFVAPVCLPCNASRHRGEMPSPQTFAAVLSERAA